MNKKLFFLIPILCVFFLVNKSFAQCTPNPNNIALITPDTITNFASGTVAVPYSQMVYVHPPIDTTGTVGTITIHVNPLDSIVLNNINNLPPGLSYACNPSNCVFPGGVSGCMAITGTPTTAGLYQLSIEITAYGKEATTGFAVFYPFTIQSYYININTNSGIQFYDPSNFQLLEFGHDPVREHLTLKMNSPKVINADVSVFNIIGKSVYGKPVLLKQGINTVDFSTKDLAPGVYILTLKNEPYVLTRRFVIGGK
jgi:type IX secretion system substrate protein